MIATFEYHITFSWTRRTTRTRHQKTQQSPKNTVTLSTTSERLKRIRDGQFVPTAEWYLFVPQSMLSMTTSTLTLLFTHRRITTSVECSLQYGVLIYTPPPSSLTQQGGRGRAVCCIARQSTTGGQRVQTRAGPRCQRGQKEAGVISHRVFFLHRLCV